MPSQSMDVFALREAVVDEYRKFATSFTTIQADDIRAQVEAIYARNQCPELPQAPHFRRGRR